MMKKPIIGFCGMTHLGICSASASLSKGFKTICFDTSKKKIANLKKWKMDIREPLINEVLFKHKNLLKFTAISKDLSACDLIYVSLDIKTDETGKSDLNELEKLLEVVRKNINKKAITVILSQVPPGFTSKYLEKFNSIYYQVETLIFGEGFNRAMYPERFILGCKNPNEPIEEPFNLFLKSFNCPILKMNYESAELSKISINLVLISNISIANKLAEICENLGASWNEIIPALRLDKRIGKYSYINAQLGISGGNLERDIASTIRILKNFNLNTHFMESYIQISNERKNWVHKVLKEKVFVKIKNPKIGIIGLSYKPNTNSIKNAPSLKLLGKLKGENLIAYDPIVNIDDIANWCKKANTLEETYLKSDVIIILTPLEELKKVGFKSFTSSTRLKYFIDPLNIYINEYTNSHNLKYYSIGQSLK